MSDSGKASFTIDCPQAGFRRHVEIPIDARGYVRQLASDFDRAIELFELRQEVATLREQVQEMEKRLA